MCVRACVRACGRAGVRAYGRAGLWVGGWVGVVWCGVVCVCVFHAGVCECVGVCAYVVHMVTIAGDLMPKYFVGHPLWVYVDRQL